MADLITMTPSEALAVAHGHYEAGSRWLSRAEDGLPHNPPANAARAALASAHFAGGQLALAIASAERTLETGNPGAGGPGG